MTPIQIVKDLDYTLSHPKNNPYVAARYILYASIPGVFFAHVRKHTNYAGDNKHLPLEYMLTSGVLTERQSRVYFKP